MSVQEGSHQKGLGKGTIEMNLLESDDSQKIEDDD